MLSIVIQKTMKGNRNRQIRIKHQKHFILEMCSNPLKPDPFRYGKPEIMRENTTSFPKKCAKNS